MRLPSRLTLAVVVSALIGNPAGAQNRTFTNQYSFGDSLSDNGNVYLASGRTANTGPYNAGGRFSNGPTFVELLGNSLAIGSAAPASVKSSMDFAFGGAATASSRNNDSGAGFPAMPEQIAMFQSHNVAIQRTDLFTFWFGANDILRTAQQASPGLMPVVGVTAAQAAAGGIQTLISLGTKNILVLNMPNIGITPLGLTSGAGSLLTEGSLAFNLEFDARLAAIAAAAPDVTLTRIDAAGVIAQVQRDYKLLGFGNANAGLSLPASQGGGGNPNDYVFFDSIHPTARTHALLARIVLEALNPEPVVGFGAAQGTGALTLRELAAGALESRLARIASAPRDSGRIDAYASFDYGSGDRVADGLRPKFTYNAQVVTAGIDARLGNPFYLGGAVQNGRLAATVSAGGGKFTVEDQSGRLYGIWRRGALAFAVDGGYGGLSVKKIQRATALGLPTNGRTGGTHWGLGASAIWTADLGGVKLHPWLGVRTERVTLDAYTESDVASLNMAYAEQEARSTAGRVGLALGGATNLAGHAVQIDFGGAWHGELDSRSRSVAGRLAGNFTRPTAIAATDGAGSGLEFSLAGTIAVTKSLSATLGYAGDIRQDDKLASRVTLSLQTGF